VAKKPEHAYVPGQFGGFGASSRAHNPFAGNGALKASGAAATGKSLNLNFKASKLEAWATETSAEKGKRETSFQLIARYKFLKKAPLFAQLSDDEIAKIAGVLEVKEYSAGQAVVTQGDAGDTFYIIESGAVDVFVQVSTRVVSVGGRAHTHAPPLRLPTARACTR
jgi:hypothetical protein